MTIHENLVFTRLRESAGLKTSFSKKLIARIADAAALITSALKKGNKVLLMGNGGSAADAQHLAGELVGRFYRDRRALPAMALHANTSVLTAVANDCGYDAVFMRQIEAWGKRGDVVIGITTSGRSPNILKGFKTARRMGMKAIAMTGKNGLARGDKTDILLDVPSTDTPRIQEAHITIGHIMCEIVEKAFV
jgi:D-sedoheptulose 7-phosphate isomerase